MYAFVLEAVQVLDQCINALQVFFVIRILIPDDIFMLSSAILVPMMSSSAIPISACFREHFSLEFSTELV